MNNLVPVLSQTDEPENGTNSSLRWDDMTLSERQIIISVIFEGTPEEARKRLSMTHSTFYRKWSKLKQYKNELISEFPKKATEVLLSQSIKAAQELGRELDSDNEKIRHQAATQLLDRTTPKESRSGLHRRVTLEEWSSKTFRQ